MSYRERNMIQRQKRAFIRSELRKWSVFLTLGLASWGLVGLLVLLGWGVSQMVGSLLSSL
jgi:hypothetical protein